MIELRWVKFLECQSILNKYLIIGVQLWLSAQWPCGPNPKSIDMQVCLLLLGKVTLVNCRWNLHLVINSHGNAALIQIEHRQLMFTK